MPLRREKHVFEVQGSVSAESPNDGGTQGKASLSPGGIRKVRERSGISKYKDFPIYIAREGILKRAVQELSN